jgi:hypothetical protein
MDDNSELYQVELWERTSHVKDFTFTETVEDNLTLEQATELRKALIEHRM